MNPSNQSALPLPQTNDITYAGSIDLLYGLQGWYLDFNYNDLVYSQQKTENDILDLLNEQHDIYNMVLVLKLHDPANCMNSIPTNINKFKNLLMLQVGSSRMWDMHLKDLPASLERLDLLDTSTNSSNQAELLEQAKQLTKIKHVRFYCSDAYMCFSDPELKEHMEYNRENCGVFPDIKTIEIIELELGDCRYTFDADWKEKAMNHPYLSLIKYRIQSLEEIKIGIKIVCKVV